MLLNPFSDIVPGGTSIFFPGALYQIWWGGESEVDVRSGEKYVANFVHQLLYLCFFSVVILCAYLCIIRVREYFANVHFVYAMSQPPPRPP